MSLRARLFLLFGGLMAVVVVGQVVLVRALTQDLSIEVGEMAIELGRDVVSGLHRLEEAHATMLALPAGAPLSCCPLAGGSPPPGSASSGQPGEDSTRAAAGGEWVSRTRTSEQGGAEVKEGEPAPVPSGTWVTQAGPGTVEIDHHVIARLEETKIRTSSATWEEMITDEAGEAPAEGVARPGEVLTGRVVHVEVKPRMPMGEPSTEAAKLQRIADGSGSQAEAADGKGGTLSPGAGAVETRHFVYQLSLDRPDAQARVLRLAGPASAREIPIPRRGMSEIVDRTARQLLLGSVGLLGLGLILAGFVAHKVSAPLRGLVDAATRVGGGELGLQAPRSVGGEVGQAIEAFNRMSSRLEALDRETRQMRAREHLSEMGEVARGLAHTLRNPLNALGLSVEELASLAPQGGQAEALANSARRQIQRIDHSIRSFLALASEGGGEAVEIDLECLLQDVALELVQDNGRRAAVAVRAEPGLPRLKGVAPELRAVLQALVANAMEASPPGGRVTARLAKEPGRSFARVEIDDEGPGVAPEVRERLFTPHVTTKATGSGMGLYLAHRIATSRYGGSLDLLPRAAGGTTAVLTLGDRTDGERG